jgi:hypothetical protein
LNGSTLSGLALANSGSRAARRSSGRPVEIDELTEELSGVVDCVELSLALGVEGWALVIAGTVSSLLVTEVVQETVGRVAADTVQRAALGVIRGERLTVEIPRRIVEHLAAAPPTDRAVDVPEQQAVAVHLVVVAEALVRESR